MQKAAWLHDFCYVSGRAVPSPQQETSVMSEPSRGRPPLVLIANAQEWSARSLETILGPAGFAVLRAYTDRNALDRARSARPDVIILDLHLPDGGGLDVCRALRADPQITPSTPILVSIAGPTTREQRLEVMRAGAMELVGQPLDGEEFCLRLQAYVRAKFDADRARDESMVDPETGLYNMRGLAKRARELGAQAFRQRTALGCVVFSPELNGGEPTSEEAILEAMQLLAKALKTTGRVSDAIGRLGPAEFAVMAPETDGEGLLKLAERLARNLRVQANGGHPTPIKLRAGYDAVPNVHATPLDPVDLLVHATSALRTARAEPSTDWIHRFERAARD
jgi:PleD family two-component response regulator